MKEITRRSLLTTGVAGVAGLVTTAYASPAKADQVDQPFSHGCLSSNGNPGINLSGTVRYSDATNQYGDSLYALISAAKIWFGGSYGTWTIDLNRWYRADYGDWQSGYSGSYPAGSYTPAWYPTKWMGWSPSRVRYGQWEVRAHNEFTGDSVVCTYYVFPPV